MTTPTTGASDSPCASDPPRQSWRALIVTIITTVFTPLLSSVEKMWTNFFPTAHNSHGLALESEARGQNEYYDALYNTLEILPGAHVFTSILLMLITFYLLGFTMTAFVSAVHFSAISWWLILQHKPIVLVRIHCIRETTELQHFRKDVLRRGTGSRQNFALWDIMSKGCYVVWLCTFLWFRMEMVYIWDSTTTYIQLQKPTFVDYILLLAFKFCPANLQTTYSMGGLFLTLALVGASCLRLECIWLFGLYVLVATLMYHTCKDDGLEAKYASYTNITPVVPPNSDELKHEICKLTSTSLQELQKKAIVQQHIGKFMWFICVSSVDTVFWAHYASGDCQSYQFFLMVLPTLWAHYQAVTLSDVRGLDALVQKTREVNRILLQLMTFKFFFMKTFDAFVVNFVSPSNQTDFEEKVTGTWNDLRNNHENLFQSIVYTACCMVTFCSLALQCLKWSFSQHQNCLVKPMQIEVQQVLNNFLDDEFVQDCYRFIQSFVQWRFMPTFLCVSVGAYTCGLLLWHITEIESLLASMQKEPQSSSSLQPVVVMDKAGWDIKRITKSIGDFFNTLMSQAQHFLALVVQFIVCLSAFGLFQYAIVNSQVQWFLALLAGMSCAVFILVQEIFCQFLFAGLPHTHALQDKNSDLLMRIPFRVWVQLCQRWSSNPRNLRQMVRQKVRVPPNPQDKTGTYLQYVMSLRHLCWQEFLRKDVNLRLDIPVGLHSVSVPVCIEGKARTIFEGMAKNPTRTEQGLNTLNLFEQLFMWGLVIFRFGYPVNTRSVKPVLEYLKGQCTAEAKADYAMRDEFFSCNHDEFSLEIGECKFKVEDIEALINDVQVSRIMRQLHALQEEACCVLWNLFHICDNSPVLLRANFFESMYKMLNSVAEDDDDDKAD
jgi:hypothetical protein